MMNKLIQNIIKLFIMIGHNLIIITLIFIMTSCNLFNLDSSGDYSYKSYVKNNTNKNLRMYISKNLTGYIVDTNILPQERVLIKGSREVDKSDNVIKDFLFGNVFIDTVQLYNQDSLVKTWFGPPESSGDSVHHFYNYDSWDVELIDNEYELTFTIYESDLEND